MTVAARAVSAYPPAGQACRGIGTMAPPAAIVLKNYPDRFLRSA
jgi:hypothetical protein